MKMMLHKRINKKGFSLIETVIAVAIFAMIMMALMDLFSLVLRNVRSNKSIVTANSLALEHMEVVRGMEFDNIKTDTGWVPTAGVDPIPSEQTIERGGAAYLVRTDVSWVDDPFDGIDEDCMGALDETDTTCIDDDDDGTDDRMTTLVDTFPYDYKKVRVRVSWNNPNSVGTSEISMSTSVAPVGLEGLGEGKGGLYLTVFDAEGKIVPTADVSVDSASTGYALTPSTGGKTDLNGNIWIPDLEPAEDYHVVVTKSGFSTAETYAVDNDPASADYNPNPEKKNLMVIAQTAVKAGFKIDLLGSLTVKTVQFHNPDNWLVHAAVAGEQTEACAATAAGNVYAAWADTRDGDKHIYMQKLGSVSGGYAISWATGDVRIVNQTNASNPVLRILPDGSLWAMWSDDRSGDSDIYLQRVSTGDGSPVGGEFMVSHGAVGTAQKNPDFTFDAAGNIYAVWEDDRGGSWDLYAQKFDPATSAFWGGDIPVNGETLNDQLDPEIVTDREVTGNNFYVVWESNHPGNFDVFVRKFDPSGTAAFADKVVNNDGGYLDQYDPSIAFDGVGNFYVAWADDRNSQPDIFLQKLDASGTRIFGSDAKINDDSYATARRIKPTLAYHSDTEIYVAWEDNRNGNTVTNIYASQINSSAERQWTYDLIAVDELDSVQTDAVTICDAAGQAVTLWQDNRSGNNDIYGAAYSGMGNFVKANVPITVISEKAKGTYGEPPIGIPKYSREFISDASGNISIGAAEGGLEWGSYTFTTDSPYTIVSYDLPAPIAIAPGGSSTIVINIGS